MNLSFRVGSAGWFKFLVLVILVPVGVLLPVGYGVYYFHYGGAEREHDRQLRELAGADPVADARAAIAEEDFRLWTTGFWGEPANVPGGRYWKNDEQRFGYRAMNLYEGDLSDEQRRVNVAVVGYMRTYNELVYEHARTRYSGG